MGVANRITEIESNQICDLFNKNNLSPTQIGKMLNRDPSSIRRVLKKHGINYNSVHYISSSELDSIILDYKSGMTPKELEKNITDQMDI